MHGIQVKMKGNRNIEPSTSITAAASLHGGQHRHN